MESVYKKDGTSLKIVTEEDVKVIDLLPYINTSDWYDVHIAYCSSRIVTITILIRSGVVDAKRTQLINDERFFQVMRYMDL